MNDGVADAAYSAGWAVVQTMPEWLARRQFDALADAVWLRDGPSVRRLQANLARVRPGLSRVELRRLTHEGVRSYLRYWCEVFKMPRMDRADLIARTTVIGDATLRNAVAAGKGMILSLPHTGNWDQAGAWLTGTGVPFTTVAERLKPESLFTKFVEFRESLGMEVIPLTGGEQPPFPILADRLRSGGTLCLLGDRDLTVTGIEVDFFGSGARMPAGPAALAHDTGAALLPVTLWYPTRTTWGLRIHDQVMVPTEGDRRDKIRAMTQQVASVFETEIAQRPQDWHMLQRVWSEDLDPGARANRLMRIGLVSPYPWDVPGGVVAHIADLAEALIARGHDVAVLSSVDDNDEPLPSYVTRAGRSVPIPYNGSVSRLLIGPVSGTRVRRWLREGDFDVLHLHSPETWSLSLLTLINAHGPIVATYHASNPRSRILSILQDLLQTVLEKVSGSIAVSPAARKTINDHLGADAVIVPNGVHIAKYAGAAPLPGYPGHGGTLGFVGRVDEPRKGLQVLIDALPAIRLDYPELRVLVAGPGKFEGEVPDCVTMLGRVSDADKARLLASVDAYVAPNTGGESFGIVLLEAMAAGAPIVASRLEAFARVLDDGRLGELAGVGDPADLARACVTLLDSKTRRDELRVAARHAVARYDWSVVAAEVIRVYETVIAASTGRVGEDPSPIDIESIERQFPAL